MKEERGNVWTLGPFDVLCITTNGFVKANGVCVMGRGIAQQVAHRHPDFPIRLGSLIKCRGNIPYALEFGIWIADELYEETYFTFPVKHNWWEKADLELIQESARAVIELADAHEEVKGTSMERIMLPRPGCGNGQLKWDDVKPVISSILDDRFITVSYA